MLEKIVVTLNLDEYHFLVKLIKKNGKMTNSMFDEDEIEYLRDVLIVIFDLNLTNEVLEDFVSGKSELKSNSSIRITDGLLPVLKKMDFDKLKNRIQFNENIKDVIKAMTYLYGVITFTEVKEVLEKEYKVALSEDQIENVYAKHWNGLEFIEAFIHQDKKYFVHTFLANEGAVKDLGDILGRRSFIKRKEIGFAELIKYKDETYYPKTRENKELYSAIKKYVFPMEEAEFALHLFMLRAGKIGFDAFAQILFKSNDEEVDKLMSYLVEAANNTIHWSNNGYAPKEMTGSESNIPYNVMMKS
jgi:hypothetical protein